MVRAVSERSRKDSDTPWLLDTSVVLDITDPNVLSALPELTAVSVVTSAELAAGP